MDKIDPILLKAWPQDPTFDIMYTKMQMVYHLSNSGLHDIKWIYLHYTVEGHMFSKGRIDISNDTGWERIIL